MATGGVLTPEIRPTQTALLAEELRAVVQEAHDAGKRVAMHAIGRQGIKNALDAGVDSIEHGYYLDEELFAQAIEQGTFLVPTLLAVDGIVKFGPAGGTPEWVIDKATLRAGRSREMFRAAVHAGVSVAAGTDAGTPFNPHTDLAKELAVMVAIGMTPMQALIAATANAAANLDLLHEIGTIEVGKAAICSCCSMGTRSRTSALAIDRTWLQRPGSLPATILAQWRCEARTSPTFLCKALRLTRLIGDLRKLRVQIPP